MALVDRKPKAPETFVLRRGDYRRPRARRSRPGRPGVILASQPARRLRPESIAPDRDDDRAAARPWRGG